MPIPSSALVRPYVVTGGRTFTLRTRDTRPRGSGRPKGEAKALLQTSIEELSELQEKLYAQDRWGVLLIFQAMDAAGKDGAIKHVMSGIDPHGVQVSSFKIPSHEELDHDFLWRTTRVLPERGRIGIFNRSYYEETLVVRVHREFLRRQKLPDGLVTKDIWKERYEDINGFERYLSRNGFLIRKFFLHLSREEQRRRFLARLEHPEKNWKFSMADVEERGRWDDYMAAYEDTIRHTATSRAPWIVVPADDKKFARLVIASAVIEALKSLKADFPAVDAAQRKALDQARRAREREPESKPRGRK